MIIEQIYTGCLSQGAYYIQSGNEVAIIDPLRKLIPICKKLKKQCKNKIYFRNAFHADFVSGHLTLEKRLVLKLFSVQTLTLSLMHLLQKMDKSLKLVKSPSRLCIHQAIQWKAQLIY